MRLSVPYISQLVNGSGGNNCGPASLAMTLAYRGVIAPTQEAMLECADIARDGLSNDVGETGGYTTFNQLAMVASWYGQATWWPTSWSQIEESILRQEPVIILLDNRVLQPRQYPNDANWAANHFILLTATEDVNRYSSDPLSYYVGAPYFYTEASTKQAVANVGGVQALALVPLELPPEPEKLMLMEDWQLKAWVLADLYNWAGVPYNPESGTAQGWVDALREGVYLGRPRTGERPYGQGEDAGVWIEFDSGVLLYRARDGKASWTG
jgi:uncharacterized protein YvpB